MKTFDEYIERIKINTVPGPIRIHPRGGDEGGVDFSSLKKKEFFSCSSLSLSVCVHMCVIKHSKIDDIIEQVK